jgi:hypothetical protein
LPLMVGNWLVKGETKLRHYLVRTGNQIL